MESKFKQRSTDLKGSRGGGRGGKRGEGGGGTLSLAGETDLCRIQRDG